jgi:hypothetical protein
MVALLQPPSRSSADHARGHLRLVVSEPAVDPAPVDRIRPAPVVVIAVAAVVFGVLGLVRVVQGAPAEPVVIAGQAGAASVVGVGSGVGVGAGTGAGAVAGAGVSVVVVAPGDTLWSIAADLVPGEDPRPLVATLIELNGGDPLQIGQQIVVPKQFLERS